MAAVESRVLRVIMQCTIRVVFLVLLFFASFNVSQAQQTRVYSQFFMNPFIYNPAYAGVEGHTVFFGMYRKQWSNIDGAPALSHVSFHTPLKGGLGIGASAYNDQEGLVNTTAIKGSVSYLLAIDRKHYLRVGMSLGGGTKSINTDGFDSPADPAFENLSESSAFTLGQFGATYHFGHFNVGFALPNLVGYEVVGQESFSKIKVDPFDEALFKANYRGHINDNIAFEPHLLYRYNQDLPNQFELAVITHLKHIVWVGASYRQDAGIVALFGTKVKEKIGIGLAYDIGNSNFSDLLGPTFELHIGYHLGTKKEHAEHVSSFIKSHRLTLEERQRKEQEKQLAEERRQEKDNANMRDQLAESRKERLNKTTETGDGGQTTETETGKDANDSNSGDSTTGEQGKPDTGDTPKPDESTDKPDEKVDPVEKEREKKQNKAIEIGKLIEQRRQQAKAQGETKPQDQNKAQQQNKAQEQSKDQSEKPSDAKDQPTKSVTKEPEGKTGGVDAKQPDEQPKTDDKDVVEQQTGNITTPDETVDSPAEEVEDNRTIEELTNSDVPKKVSRGNHMLELNNGHYVVAGAFKVFDHAEDFSDELFEKGYRDVIVGYISETELYYVVIFQSKNLDNAKRRRTALKNRNGLQEIWLLTVE